MMYDNLGLVSSDSSFNNEYFRFTADQVCHAEGKFITDKFQHRGMFDIPRAWGGGGDIREKLGSEVCFPTTRESWSVVPMKIRLNSRNKGFVTAK